MNAPSEARQSLTDLSNEADAINLRDRNKSMKWFISHGLGHASQAALT